jgi:hypothetical protein
MIDVSPSLCRQTPPVILPDMATAGCPTHSSFNSKPFFSNRSLMRFIMRAVRLCFPRKCRNFRMVVPSGIASSPGSRPATHRRHLIARILHRGGKARIPLPHEVNPQPHRQRHRLTPDPTRLRGIRRKRRQQRFLRHDGLLLSLENAPAASAAASPSNASAAKQSSFPREARGSHLYGAAPIKGRWIATGLRPSQ